MSDSTEFLLYRGKCKSEIEYENFKLSFKNIGLLATYTRTSVICELQQNVKCLNEGFEEFENNIELLNTYSIDYNPEIKRQKNEIQNSFYNHENTIKENVEYLKDSIASVIEAADETEQELKDMLRQCLEENLEECEASMLDALFVCNDVNEIKDLFQSKDEFYRLIKEKPKAFNKLDPMIAYSTIAKAAAVKVVSPMLAEKERERKIKDNLSKVKPCIKAVETKIKGFMSQNTADTSAFVELIQDLKDKNHDLAELVDVNMKREIANKLKESSINESAKAPARKLNKPGLDEPITASLIMPR